MVRSLTIETDGQGLHEITDAVNSVVHKCEVEDGLCTVFIQHTSASLVIQENADPSVQRDLQNWINRLVKEHDPNFTHTTEGPDDMPAHIKSALTSVSLSIPVIGGRLGLGTWQGIYLWEHRRRPHRRSILVHVA